MHGKFPLIPVDFPPKKHAQKVWNQDGTSMIHIAPLWSISRFPSLWMEIFSFHWQKTSHFHSRSPGERRNLLLPRGQSLAPALLATLPQYTGHDRQKGTTVATHQQKWHKVTTPHCFIKGWYCTGTLQALPPKMLASKIVGCCYRMLQGKATFWRVQTEGLGLGTWNMSIF